jgi:hypothetical protein
MSKEPVICFGQQPCGFFPRRFLVAKFVTARRLQAQLGGRIVFFYHDSDHDPRETQTILRHKKTGEAQALNFAFENKVQRKYSPLYLKRIPKDWCTNTARQLGAYVNATTMDIFKSVKADNVADFCLEMYRAMRLIDGMEVLRSSSPDIRARACEIEDYFVDVPYCGEVVRARHQAGELLLHEGGDAFLKIPSVPFGKAQISPTRDTRLRWMQSVIGCTHYVCGAGEQAYLRQEEAPDIQFVPRDAVDRSDEAYIPDVPL